MQNSAERAISSTLTAMALVSVLTLTVSGCRGSVHPSARGPLGGGAFGSISGGDDCAPGRVNQPQTFGDERFTNNGKATVVLDRVVLLRPHNERLAGSYAMPGNSLIGVPGDWPPKYAGIPSAWKHHKPTRNFRLAAGKSFNMLPGVTATAINGGRSAGIVIYYHDSAGSYELTDHLALTIVVGKPKGCN